MLWAALLFSEAGGDFWTTCWGAAFPPPGGNQQTNQQTDTFTNKQIHKAITYRTGSKYTHMYIGIKKTNTHTDTKI